MTDIIISLLKWTKKLINEVIQLRNRRRESLNSATNRKEENNLENEI